MAVSVKLDVDIDRRLRVLAREKSCSHHYMMCEAIRRFVEEEEARLSEGKHEAVARNGDGGPAMERTVRPHPQRQTA